MLGQAGGIGAMRKVMGGCEVLVVGHLILPFHRLELGNCNCVDGAATVKLSQTQLVGDRPRSLSDGLARYDWSEKSASSLLVK